MAIIFGKGILQIFSMVLGWFLWAYLWCVFAATGIYWVRSDFDIVDTLENVVWLVLYPLVEIIMDIFVVLPYKYIICPLDRWWAYVHIPYLKTGAKNWNQLSDVEKQNKVMWWIGTQYPTLPQPEQTELYKIFKDSIPVYEAENDTIWQPLGDDPSGNPSFYVETPQMQDEYAYFKKIAYDIAEPMFEEKHGYKPPKYCKQPDEPIARGCVKPPTTMFSWDWWFCRQAVLKENCTTKCD